jgi:hypothetical protein
MGLRFLGDLELASISQQAARPQFSAAVLRNPPRSVCRSFLPIHSSCLSFPFLTLILDLLETLQARYRQRAAEKEKYSITINREVEKKADIHKL